MSKRTVWLLSLLVLGVSVLVQEKSQAGPRDSAETLSAESQGSLSGPLLLEAPETLSAEVRDDAAIPIAQPGPDPMEVPLPPKTESLPAPTSTGLGGESTIPVESGEAVDCAPTALVGGGYFESAPTSWYGRLDYLYWEATDPKRNANVFVTDSTSNTSPNFNNRINLSDPNTDHEMGLRFWLGRQLGDNFGVEAVGLWVYPTNWLEAFAAGVDSGGIFGGTTINTVAFAPTGEAADFANMSLRSRYWGTELNGRWNLWRGSLFDFDLIGGARYLDYAERLAFGYQLASASGPITERFETNNNMIGGQMGGDLRAYLCRYVALLGTGRAGLLSNFQDVNVKGPAPGQGRLTNTSNLGVTDETELSVLLEFNLGVEFLLTPNLSIVTGYSGIWLDHQLRATEQVDLVNAVPGGSPVVSLETDSLWLQGFTLSLTAKW